MSDVRDELQDGLLETGLTQVALARALGVSPMTVSRWFMQGEKAAKNCNAFPPPQYAVAFVRAFRMLSESKRAALLAGLVPSKEKAGA